MANNYLTLLNIITQYCICRWQTKLTTKRVWPRKTKKIKALAVKQLEVVSKRRFAWRGHTQYYHL